MSTHETTTVLARDLKVGDYVRTLGGGRFRRYRVEARVLSARWEAPVDRALWVVDLGGTEYAVDPRCPAVVARPTSERDPEAIAARVRARRAARIADGYVR